MVMRREDSNYCLAYFCDDGSYDWVLSMDICEGKEEEGEQVVNEAEKKMEEPGPRDNFQCDGFCG